MVNGLNGDTSLMLALGGIFLLTVSLVSLALYVYGAWALMVIAQKTKTKNPWLAWIPFANLYLMTDIAKVPWWTLLSVILTIIPIINLIGIWVFIGVTIWWWWKIAEVRGRPGWWSLLMLIPIVNLVILGILAWGK